MVMDSRLKIPEEYEVSEELLKELGTTRMYLNGLF